MSDKHILVVEDESSIREMLRFALQREGFNVAEAGDVQSARVKIADQRPDMMLLDWMLPGVSGIEFARELKSHANFRDIPVIMLTARAEEEDKVRGLEMLSDRDEVCGQARGE